MSLKRHIELTERARAVGSGVGYHDPITATALAITALTGGQAITAPLQAVEENKALKRQQDALLVEGAEVKRGLRDEERRRRARGEALSAAAGVGGSAELSNLAGAFSLLDDLGRVDRNLLSNINELQRRRQSATRRGITAGFSSLAEGAGKVGLVALDLGLGTGKPNDFFSKRNTKG